MKTSRRQRETVSLLADIKAGRKHTRSNAALAPLAQADLIEYDHSPKGSATNVRLTIGGESYLAVMQRREKP